MTRMTPEQIAHSKRATERARAVIKPGDRISRNMCGGIKQHFIFDHWEGDWMCGKTSAVSDCHAKHVYRVNGKLVSFRDTP